MAHLAAGPGLALAVEVQAGAGLAEPKVEDLGARSFAGQNIAEDVEQQARDRGAGLGAGDARNRDARYPAQGDGEVPEDDLD